jgi:hypothetical protein
MEKLSEIYLGYKDARVTEDNDAYSTKLGGVPVNTNLLDNNKIKY